MVKQLRRVCTNINGGEIMVKGVGCVQVMLQHHLCCPLGEGGNATLEQRLQGVSGESCSAWQKAPSPLSNSRRAWGLVVPRHKQQQQVAFGEWYQRSRVSPGPVLPGTQPNVTQSHHRKVGGRSPGTTGRSWAQAGRALCNLNAAGEEPAEHPPKQQHRGCVLQG